MTTPKDSELVLLDSSGWLEYLTEDSLAEKFSPHLGREEAILTPTIVLYEVLRKLLSVGKAELGERFLSHALRTQVVSLDQHLAVAAATVSLEHRLAMADAIIYATALAHQAQFVTSDAHLRDLPGVTLI